MSLDGQIFVGARYGRPCYNYKCSKPRNAAKYYLPQNVAPLLGTLIRNNLALHQNVADTDPTKNVATSVENVSAVDLTQNVAQIM